MPLHYYRTYANLHIDRYIWSVWCAVLPLHLERLRSRCPIPNAQCPMPHAQFPMPLDIATAAQKVLAFKQGFNKTAFLGDDKTQSAIVYQLLIIGEAVKRLSQELRNQNPAIPWSAIAPLRDNLSHDYDDIDLDRGNSTNRYS